MQTLIQGVLEKLDSAHVLWAGSMPPRADMSDGSAIFDPQRDFRLPAHMHQAHDLVLTVERDLASIKQWPLVLDEALRAVSPGGILVVRLSQSAVLSVFQFANFVEKWTRGAFEMLDQVNDGGQFVFALRLTHEQRRPASVETWSFGLVTDGRKPASVKRFVDSVVALDGAGSARHELLICGPRSVLDDLGDQAGLVKLVEQPEAFSDRGWITRKKNLLVQASSHENVLIAHDRYTVTPSFAAQMDRFGGDFDVVVPRQETVDGLPMPDWVMLSDPLNWATPGWLEYGDYHPYVYINGGVIIAKRDLLAEVRWSEMLFWAQAEDVELTRRLEDRGVTARLGRNIRLLSEAPRGGFLEGFERLPWLDAAYAQSGKPTWQSRVPLAASGVMVSEAAALEPDMPVLLDGVDALTDALEAGVVLLSAWARVGGGLSWTAEADPEFSFKLAYPISEATLSLKLASAAHANRIAAVRINSVRCTAIQQSGEWLDVVIPREAMTASAITHVWLERVDERPIVLCSLSLKTEPDRDGYGMDRPLRFGLGDPDMDLLKRGWHAPESWGAWSAAAKSEFILTLGRASSRSLKGRLQIQAFCPPGIPEQVVTLLVDREPVGSWIFSEGQGAREVDFLTPIPAPNGRMRFSFVVSRTTSPKAAGVADDHRQLGVGLMSLTLTDEG